MKVDPKRFLWSPGPGVHYVRRKGKYWRIRAVVGSEDFDRQYWAILNGKAPAPRTSWNALIERYCSSDRWLGLKTRTRADYQIVLDYLAAKNGDRDMTKTRRADVLAAMEKNRDRVRFANYIPQVMSVLCEYAIDLGWISANPVKGTRRLATPESKKQVHVPWTDEAVKKWRAGARPLARLIFEIGVGSVQRPADWCRFRWADYDGDTLKVTQGKTGKSLTLPCTAALRAALDTARPDPCDLSKTILRKADGNPFSYHGMSAVMLGERRRLGVAEFDLHALRYRGVMELAWSGCNDDEIAAYSGHASKAMIAKYAGEARQIMQARSARDKRG